MASLASTGDELIGGLQSKRLVFRKWTAADGPLGGRFGATRRLPHSSADRSLLNRWRRDCGENRVLRVVGPTVSGPCSSAPAPNSSAAAGCLLPPARARVRGWLSYPNRSTRARVSPPRQEVIRHAFKELELSALFAGHHPNNRASASVLRKLGFRHTHHELYPPTGLEHPSYLLVRPSASRE